MLENPTNNVTLCYKLGGKFTGLEWIRCVICTGISTLQGETANFGFACFCVKMRVICEDVPWCIFMSLWLKRFQWFPTGHCLKNADTMSTPDVVIYAWHCIPLPRPSCRRQETASFRREHILPKYRYQFQAGPKHALTKLQWIAWIQNS